MTRFLSLLLLLACCLPGWATGLKVSGIATNLLYEYSSGEHRWPGIVTVDMESPLNYTKDWGERNIGFLNVDFMGHGIMIDDILHVFCYRSQKISFIRYQKGADGTWSHINTGGKYYVDKGSNLMTSYPMSMSYDPQTETIYGFRNDNDHDVDGNLVSTIYTISRENGDMTKHGILDRRISSLFSDIKGNIYALDYDGNFYNVNIIAGTTKLVGATGFSSNDIIPCCVDNATGKVIAYYVNSMKGHTPALYEIDPKTGQGVKTVEIPIAEFGYLRSIFSASDVVEGANGVPGRCQDITFAATPGSLKGRFNVTAPLVNLDNEQLTGMVDIDILLNGEIVAEISGVQPGELGVSNEYTFSAGGMQAVTAVPHNEIGDGAPLNQNLWIGFDTPAAPVDALLSIAEDGSWTCSWTAPAIGSHGMPIDTESLKYEILIVPGGEMFVVDETNATGVITSKIYNNYYVQVTPFSGGLRGETAISNTVEHGIPYVTPYYQPFSEESSLQEHVVKDIYGNAPARWYKDPDGLTAIYLGQSQDVGPVEAWLFSPPIKLSKGAEYTVTAKAASWFTINDVTGQNLDIMVCPDTETGHAVKIGGAENLEQYFIGYTDVTATYTPEEDCVVRFALRNHSNNDKTAACGTVVLEYTVDGTASADAPAKVTGFKATPGAEGALSADLEFTLPLRTAGGANLASVSSVKIYRDGILTPVHEITTDVTPGGKVTWTDNITDGLHKERSWQVRVFNDAGAGVPAECSAWVGQYIADAPRDFRVAQTETAFKLAWDKPEGASDPDKYVDIDNLTYTIMVWYDPMDMPAILKSDIKETALTLDKQDFRILDRDGQLAMSFYVFGVSPAGDGVPAMADIIAGTGYSLPYSESFDATYGTLTTPWGVRDLPGETRPYEQCWYPIAEAKSPSEVESQDGDGAMAMFYQKNFGNYQSRLISPTISFQGPALMSFWVWHRECGEDNGLQIEMLSTDNEGRDVFTAIGSPVQIGDNDGWKNWQAYLDPADFGTSGRIVFRGSGDIDTDFYIDNITVNHTDMARPAELVWMYGTDSVAEVFTNGYVPVAGDGFLYVPGGDWQVFAVDGRIIVSGHGAKRMELHPGIYIVRTNAGAQKVHVR